MATRSEYYDTNYKRRYTTNATQDNIRVFFCKFCHLSPITEKSQGRNDFQLFFADFSHLSQIDVAWAYNPKIVGLI